MSRKHLSPLVAGLVSMVVGIGIGGTAVGYWAKTNTEEVLKVLTTGQALEAIKHARLLRSGDMKSVLTDREKSLELIVNWYRAFNYMEPDDIRLLYSIKGYRDQWSLLMPDDINKYLNELPPRPLPACVIDQKNKEKAL
jgi:hypothetical protein